MELLFFGTVRYGPVRSAAALCNNTRAGCALLTPAFFKSPEPPRVASMAVKTDLNVATDPALLANLGFSGRPLRSALSLAQCILHGKCGDSSFICQVRG